MSKLEVQPVIDERVAGVSQPDPQAPGSGLRVLHVAPYLYPAIRFGGPALTTYSECRSLAQLGCTVRALTTNANGRDTLDLPTTRECEMAGFSARYCRRTASESFSLDLLRVLPSYIRWANVVHLHAVYSAPTIPTLAVARLFRKPVVWEPHGSLMLWPGRSRPQIKHIWEKVCKRVNGRTNITFQASSEQELLACRQAFPEIPVQLVIHGVDIPDAPIRTPRNGTLRILHIGRHHPIKAIEHLIKACHSLTEVQWSLTLAGAGDDNYTDSLRQLVTKLRLERQVDFVGFVDGNKSEVFSRSDIMVLPSHSENFGKVVAEALAHEVPVIASRGTPWKRLEEKGCGLWVDNTPESLAQALAKIDRMPLASMGARGRDWMIREFNWLDRAHELIQLYRSQLGEFPCPLGQIAPAV